MNDYDIVPLTDPASAATMEQGQANWRKASAATEARLVDQNAIANRGKNPRPCHVQSGHR